jgi:hypothetical protein
MFAHTIKGSAVGVTVTTDAIVTTGSDIIVFCAANIGAIPIQAGMFSDSASNVWTSAQLINHSDTGSGVNTAIYAIRSPTTNASHTFTFDSNAFGGGTGYPTIAVFAASGSTSIDSGIVSGSDHGAIAATIQAGSITPSAGAGLIIAFVAISDGTNTLSAPVAIGSGFTVADTVLQGTHWFGESAYLIQGSASAVNPQWSWTGNLGAAAVIASFKGTFSDAGGGGGGTGGGLLLFGGSVGWTPLLGAAAAWKAGNAIRRNATLGRRRLLIGKW